TAADEDEAERVLRRFRSGSLKPRYWHLNNRLPVPDRSWLRKAWNIISTNWVERGGDMTVAPVRSYLSGAPFRRMFRYMSARLTGCFERPRQGERFVLYTLHKQPEASIDVLGAGYANQVDLI